MSERDDVRQVTDRRYVVGLAKPALLEDAKSKFSQKHKAQVEWDNLRVNVKCGSHSLAVSPTWKLFQLFALSPSRRLSAVFE